MQAKKFKVENIFKVWDGLGGPWNWASQSGLEKLFPEAVEVIKDALMSGIVPERYYNPPEAALAALSYMMDCRLTDYPTINNGKSTLVISVSGKVHYKYGNAWVKTINVLYISPESIPAAPKAQKVAAWP